MLYGKTLLREMNTEFFHPAICVVLIDYRHIYSGRMSHYSAVIGRKCRCCFHSVLMVLDLRRKKICAQREEFGFFFADDDTFDDVVMRLLGCYSDKCWISVRGRL